MKQLFSLAAGALLAVGVQAQTTFNVDMTCAPEGFENVFVTGPGAVGVQMTRTIR